MKVQNTKQMRQAYRTWKHSTASDLEDVYSSYSRAKANAYQYCLDLYYEYDGSYFKIVSHNSMVFSVGFIGYINGLKHFFYITRDYDRAMPLEFIDEDGCVNEILFAC